MYTESTGRGHLDGICVHPSTRGTGLGKALFCYLCDYLKKDGYSGDIATAIPLAKYMVWQIAFMLICGFILIAYSIVEGSISK